MLAQVLFYWHIVRFTTLSVAIPYPCIYCIIGGLGACPKSHTRQLEYLGGEVLVLLLEYWLAIQARTTFSGRERI